MKTELWNNYPIRFVEKDGEWWAVLKDVCDALTLSNPTIVASRLEKSERSKFNLGRQGYAVVISEFGIYQTIFQSRKKEAKDFQRWAYSVLKELRQSSGLEGFQVFRMLDKEHQKEMMGKLHKSLEKPVRVDFIKANTIANKAVSTKYGFSKMVKKSSMTPEMLVDRQELLQDTVELMGVKEKYHLDISVSDEVYKLAEGRQVAAS